MSHSFRFSILATQLRFLTRAQYRHHALTPRDPLHLGRPALAIDVDWRRRPIFPRTHFVMNTEPDGRSAARGWPPKSTDSGTVKEFKDQFSGCLDWNVGTPSGCPTEGEADQCISSGS